MSDTSKTKELYGLYVRRFGSCHRTPYQADYYKQWLDLLNACSSNEEAEAKSKENGLYTAGAAAVVKDRFYANKQAAQELGWSDVEQFCEDMIQKIEADPYYPFTHTGMWGDLQALKDRWLRTIEGFHQLFTDFLEFDDTRSDAGAFMRRIAEAMKMLSKPSSDFATLAALPQFREMIDCSDAYYAEFVDTVSKAASGIQPDTISWSAAEYKDQIKELWDQRNSLKAECSEWRNQPVKPCCVRLSPDSPDGKYSFIEID